jgi:hypothetical protein
LRTGQHGWTQEGLNCFRRLILKHLGCQQFPSLLTHSGQVLGPLHLLDKATQGHVKSSSNASHVHKANVSSAPLDITDVSPVNIREFREPLLGNSTLQAKLPDSLPERQLRIAFLWRSHGLDAMGKMAMSLQTMSGCAHTSIGPAKVTHRLYASCRRHTAPALFEPATYSPGLKNLKLFITNTLRVVATGCPVEPTRQ